MTGSSGAIGIGHRDGDTPFQRPRRLSHNELEMARQYSEASARISVALERKGKKGKDEGTEELKKELEMWEHKVPAEELAERLGSHLTDGLTSQDAAKRLERDGPNTLSPPKVTPWWVKLLKQFTNFFAILLQIASVLCFIGYGLDQDDESNLYLGIVLYAVVIITAIFSFFQEHKSEKTMEKFKNFLPPQAAVYRDGRLCEVPAQDLVVGDLVDVKLGDKIPADVRVTANQKLKVDNSPLTGESEPVGRSVDMTDENPLETRNLAFFGTLAVDGTAQGFVVNTGDNTVFGRIAGLAAGSVSEETTLQRDIHHFVMIISAVAISLGVLFFIIGLIKGTEIIRNIVFCIGIIVANVPEGLLATVTVALTLSAKRMAKKNVLVKKLEAVETLGSTTCICSDKTGTLTQNRMTIVHVAYDKHLHTTKTAGQESTFNQDDKCFKDLFFIAACCGKAVFDISDMEQFPEKSIDERKVNGDASEAGILKFVEKITPVLQYRDANPRVSGIPFNSTNKFMITINQDSTRSGDYPLRLCMKGAPERVIDRCTHIMTNDGIEELTAENRAIIDEQLAFMMERGERVLGFAQMHLDENKYTRDYVFDPEEVNFPMDGLTFVGSMALLDPPREAVPHSVETCQNAGVKVIMVTGDHPATAKSIAKQVNIIRDPTAQDIAKERGVPVDQIDPSEVKSIVVPGSQIKDLEEEDWNRVLAHDQIVFARTSPQQKLIIVENNQRLHHVVAVTGDGVNDSPALKKANIGIAMGIAGSDVSKEAADMILLDDNFASIVNGIEEGRLIFDNLKKSIAYTLTSNIPEITPFLTFIIIQLPQPLTTILILCIDLGTDLLPAISLAYEEPESDIMRRPPRDARVDRLVNSRLISFSYFQIGVIQALAGFYSYFVVFNDYGIPPGELPFLDKDAYYEEESQDEKRWLFVEQEEANNGPFQANWYSEKAFDGAFKEDGEELIYNEILPTESSSESNTRFNTMIRSISRETGRPPCLQFECETGNNDLTCLSNPDNDFTLTGIFQGDDSVNPSITEGQDPGQGCFRLWSEKQQDEVLKRAQTAFFVSIVIVQIGGLLVCKTRVLSWFQQGMRNLILNIGILEELLLCAALCYIPPIQRAFGTRPLKFVHWLPAVPFMIFIFVYDEVRKWWLRKGDRTGNKFGRWIRENTYW